METIAKEQGVTFKQGDIIIVRSGFTEALSTMNGDEQTKALGTHRTCGVEGSEESAKWFWNKHFAAVAGDAIAFEAIPPIVDGKEGTVADLGKSTEYLWSTQDDCANKLVLVLHQYFLSLFGMPIGELWDLKALSEQCAKSNKYTFLLTSIPLNVPGAIGSPPNALAIF
jgi:kynurenine formamidase